MTCNGSRITAGLGDGNDSFVTHGVPAVVDGGAGADLLVGGVDADSLTGGPGPDALHGGSGDQLFALDGTPDGLTCTGGGAAEFDPADAVAGCSGSPNAALTDADGDGAPVGQDCDDGNPMRYLGAPDFPSNAVDEDCDGADDINLDVEATATSGPTTATTATPTSSRTRSRSAATASTRTATSGCRTSSRWTSS